MSTVVIGVAHGYFGRPKDTEATTATDDGENMYLAGRLLAIGLCVGTFFGGAEVLLQPIRGDQHRTLLPSVTPAFAQPDLFAAAHEGDAATVARLLDNGADPNEPGQRNQTALMAAAFVGATEVVEVLLTAGADVDLLDEEGRSALFFAAHRGSAGAVDALIDGGAAVDVQTLDGATPILAAAAAGHGEIVSRLLAADAAVDIAAADSRTALWHAVKAGSVGIARALLDAGANPDVRPTTRPARQTPLGLAILSGNRQLVDLLLAAEASHDLADDDGWTPFLVALAEEDMELAWMLLERGVDLTAGAGARGTSALHFAAQAGDLDMVNHLLGQGMAAENADGSGRTPLVMAAEGTCSVEIAARLLTAGADVDARWGTADDPGYGALHYAARCGSLPLVELLIDEGATVDLLGDFGQTPLYAAAGHGDVQIVDALLVAGASPHLASENAVTPLHQAARLGHLDALDRLLTAGAEIDPADQDGETPLYLAVEERRADVVDRLLTAGADVNVRQEDGRTALMQAARRGYPEMVTLLIEGGADLTVTNDDGATAFDLARSDEVRALLDPAR